LAFVRIPGNDVPSGAEEHWLEGRGGVRVRVMTTRAGARLATRGTVIICPGRAEFIEKYFEVVRELQQRGFAVFCIDWRGQGLSGREANDPLKGHFENFDDPVNDLASALRILADGLPRPHIGLAHSMGGAILLRAMQTRRVEVDAAAFSSPMWGIANLGKFAISYVRFMASVGAGAQFAPGVERKWRREPFKRNPVTHDAARHARAQDLLAEEPRLAICGPTIGWVAAAVDVIDGFHQPSALAHLRLPMLVLSAGQDVLVDNKAQKELAEHFPDCQFISIDNAKHEVLMETDDIRAQFWSAFDALTARVAR
jgi:lysophospholipase